MKRTLALLVPWTLLPGAVLGAGYYLPNQDAFATAKGNAFVATADSAAAVFYNPAGLTQLSQPEADVGVYAIILGNRADINGTPYYAKTQLQAAPEIYFASPINDRFTFGFGVNSPFGLGTQWGDNTEFSAIVTKAVLIDLSATPAIAWKITDEISLGASLSFNYQELTLDQDTFGAGSFFNFKGNGTSVSGSLSARWQPSPEHAFGLVYSSRSTTELRGNVATVNGIEDGNYGASTSFMTPQRVAFGYSYRPAPGWNIEADVEWLDWSQLSSLNINNPGLFNGSENVAFYWKSGFIYELGVSHVSQDGWIVAAGYDYNENVEPDANFNPGAADANRSWLNAGFGKRTGDHTWFIAYQYGFSDRTVSGYTGNNLLGETANGKYQSHDNALVLSWQQRF